VSYVPEEVLVDVLSPAAAQAPGILMVISPEPSNWLGELLASRGHTTVHIQDVAQAPQRIADEEADLVVLDASLPALALTALLAGLHRGSHGTLPVVITSDRPISTAQQGEWRSAGAWECLTPSTAVDLSATLHRLDAALCGHHVAAGGRLGILVDPRTGLYNRFGLGRRARELGAQAFRTHESLACVVIEVTLEPDDEDAMTEVARAIRDEGRESDIVARLGEREVGLLAPRTDLDGAVRIAERIARVVRTRAIRSGEAPVRVDLRAAYDAVASAGYVPIQPIDLVTAAAAALRARPRGDSGQWLRRSGGHRGIAPGN
jgi:diguanylate cyclase (GGDEF)-like protein